MKEINSMTINFDYGEVYSVRFRVNRIIREYEDSYFKIFRATIYNYEPEDPRNTMPLNGTEIIYSELPTLIEGNTYKGEVTMVKNEKYGMNLRVKGTLDVVEPEDKNEYKNFLINSFKGIGEVYARRLVDMFGMNVIEQVLNNKRALALAGVPDSVSSAVKSTAQGMTGHNQLIGFFNEFNIPVRVAIDVYKEIGGSAREQIQVNPWIITSIDYSYFGYADIIGQAFSKSPTDEGRISSGILSYLKDRMNAGHMAIYEDELYNADFRKWLTRAGDYPEHMNSQVRNDVIQEQLEILKSVWILETPTNKMGDKLVYFRTTLQVEENIISDIQEFTSTNRLPIAGRLEVPNYLQALKDGFFLTREDKIVGKKPFIPAEEQKQAIEMALTNPLSIITGGPGTGKTTVVNAIVQAIEYLKGGSSIAMLAPTGKAAKRMSEIAKRPAMTIHKKLNLQPGEFEGDIVEINEDYVIVDESSMVDAHLFSTLINNLSPHTSLLLVGDVNQLPSVGSGAILRDFIDSNVIPTTRLLKVFRQAEESPIVSNAYKLNNGEPSSTMKFERDSGMEFYQYKNDHTVQKLIIRYVHHLLARMNLDDIVVLSPMRKGILGVTELNRKLQESINPESKYKQQILLSRKNDLYLRENDRVMQIANDSEKGISNGETGIIEAIYEEEVEDDKGNVKNTTCIDVLYEDSYLGERVLTYTVREAREQLELAYAITIHKSQGSEYKAVVMPFTREHRFMLKRDLIYTAWTRAKELVTNIGDIQWVDYAAQNNDNVLRISQIREKLENLKAAQAA